MFEDYGYEIRSIKGGKYVIIDNKNEPLYSFGSTGSQTQKTISEKFNIPIEDVEIAIARLLIELDDDLAAENDFKDHQQTQTSLDAPRVPKPGDCRYWEQIKDNGEPLFVFYRPPNEITEKEGISYDHYHRVIKEKQEVVYVPMMPIPWPMCGKPLEPNDRLFEDIKSYVYDHVDLPDKRLYDVITSWILLTWIPEAFNVAPYLRFLGTKNVGKTRALEVLQQLSYRGTLSPSVTEAALFRLLEGYHITYLLDETEIYGTEQKQAIQNVLNAGYRRGQSVFRVESTPAGEQIVTGFQVFGPKALAGTRVLQATLESRCIQIVMEKTTRKINFTLDLPRAKTLRSRLLLWRFRRLNDLENAYSSEASEASEASEVYNEPPKTLQHITNSRVVELYAPLITICSDENFGKNITDYATDSFKDLQEEDSTGVEAQVVSAIIAACNYLESGAEGIWKFSTARVTEAFNMDKNEKEQWRSTSVGRVIKRLGFKSRRMGGGTAGYEFDSDKLEKLCSTYSLEGLKVPSLASLPSPPSLKDYADTPGLQEKIEEILDYIRENDESSEYDMIQELDIELSELKKILNILLRDGACYSPRVGIYKIS